MPFIPPYHKNLENTRVRLRVLDVDHCPWSVYSLASVDEELQTIEFIPRPQQRGSCQPPVRSPRSGEGTANRLLPILQRLPTKSALTSAYTGQGLGGLLTNSSSNANPPQLKTAAQSAANAASEGYLGLDEDYVPPEGDTRYSVVRVGMYNDVQIVEVSGTSVDSSGATET